MATSKSSTEQSPIIRIDIDGKKYRVELAHSRSAAELRIILSKRYHISSNTHFLDAEDYTVHPEDEKSVIISHLLHEKNIVKLVTDKSKSTPVLTLESNVDVAYTQSVSQPTGAALCEVKLFGSTSTRKACKDQVTEELVPRKLSNIDFHDRIDRLDAKLDKFEIKIDRIDANTQEILNQMRYVMTQMYELHEFTTPRYFFILPAKHHDWAVANTVQNLFHVHYKLYFLCECSDEPKKLHFALHDGYSIKKPREFIARYGPYLRTTLSVVQVLLTLGGFVIPKLENVSAAVGKSIPMFFQSSANFEGIQKKVEFVHNLLDKTDSNLTRAASSMLQQAKPQGAPLQGADLRELESYLRTCRQ